MVEELGYIAYEAQRPRFLELPGLSQGGCQVGAETQQRIDNAVRGIVMNAFDRTIDLLGRNRDVLERCARELLVRETLDEAAIRELTQGLRAERAAGAMEQPSPAA
jgi:cell division protease FtsH